MTQPAQETGVEVAPSSPETTAAANSAPAQAQASQETVLEIRGLSKVFRRGFLRRETVAVREVNFAVRRGEVFGFLGPNGAGKTTTIKMLMGLLHPTAGSASLLGMDAGDVRAKSRIGYLPENPYFYDYLSAVEYMHMVGRFYGLPGDERRKKVDDLLEQLGVGMAKNRAMRSYSKGMMQRVGLAQAIIGDPELVVLDEPMSGLDPLGRKEVRDLIIQLRDAGRTVFFSTHILSDAELLCDRVGLIVKGEMKHVGELSELLDPSVQVEIQWQAPESALAELRAMDLGLHKHTSEGEVLHARGREAADSFVAKVIELGGRVLKVVPHRQTLEEMFMEGAAGAPEQLRS